MKFCPSCESPVCDFCKWFDFNGEERPYQLLPDEEPRMVNTYVGDGFCRHHQRDTDPDDVCDDFVCFDVKEETEECPG